MDIFDRLVVTQIEPPVIVHSQKGRNFQMSRRQSFGLSLCISGQISYVMDGKRYISDPSNAVLLPQDGRYSLHGDKEGLFPLINFHCTGLETCGIMVLPLENPQACLKEFEDLQNLFLHRENRLSAFSAFYRLLAVLHPKERQVPAPLAAAVDYIDKNLYDSSLSNETLALEIGISEVYLRKLFTRHLNITPKQYILNARLRKAKRLLVDTSLTVTEIAENCGFSSLYHFCRAFKAKTGTTPSEYASGNKIRQI